MRCHRYGILAGLAVVCIAGAAMAAETHEADPITIVLTGQTMIRSDFRATSPSFSAAIKPLLKGDAVFTNFESMIAEPGQPNDATPVHGANVHAPPESLDALMGIGVNLLSFANNHAWDMEDLGLQNSITEADRRHLAHAGTGATIDQAAAPVYLHTPHGTVGLIALASGLLPDGAGATATRPGVNEVHVPGAAAPTAEDAGRILAAIREAAAKSDLVVAYHHNHVYEKPFMDMFRKGQPERLVPPPWIKTWARQEIDAGADVVVMHGAPVVQGVEIYHGKPIFYDLGNFMFNLDHRDDAVFAEQDIWESVIATATFDKRTLRSITFRPVALNKDGRRTEPLFVQTRGMPTAASDAQAQAILANLAALSKPFGTEIAISGDAAAVKLKP